MKKKNTIPDSFDELVDVTKETTKKAGKKSKEFWNDFKKFVAKGNVIDLAVAFGMLLGKISQTVLQVCIVGLHLDHIAGFAEIDDRCFLLLGKSCSHKTS